MLAVATGSVPVARIWGERGKSAEIPDETAIF